MLPLCIGGAVGASPETLQAGRTPNKPCSRDTLPPNWWEGLKSSSDKSDFLFSTKERFSFDRLLFFLNNFSAHFHPCFCPLCCPNPNSISVIPRRSPEENNNFWCVFQVKVFLVWCDICLAAIIHRSLIFWLFHIILHITTHKFNLSFFRLARLAAGDENGSNSEVMQMRDFPGKTRLLLPWYCCHTATLG